MSRAVTRLVDRGGVPLGVLVALAALATLAPLVSPFAPDALDLAVRRGAPSLSHWFGTDELGRDVLARVLYGGRVSLAIGVLSALLSVTLGTLIGTLAGLLRGITEGVLMRITDAVLAIPRLPLLMILSAIMQPSIPLLIVLVGSTGWMETARVVRAEVLTLVDRGFVEAAHAAGSPTPLIVWRHLLPNVAATIGVAATLSVGRALLLESALSFFGVGVQPPDASWGNMLYQAQSTMTTEPWLALFPGLAIFITVFFVNSLGQRLAPVERR